MGRKIAISWLNARQTPQYSYQISGTSRSEALFRKLQVGLSPPDLMWQLLPKDLFRISWVSKFLPSLLGSGNGYMGFPWTISLNLFISGVAPQWTRATRVAWRSKWKWFVYPCKMLVKEPLFMLVAPLSILTLYDYIVILNREKPKDGVVCSIALAPQICAFALEVHFEAPEVRKTTGSGAPRKKFWIILWRTRWRW